MRLILRSCIAVAVLSAFFLTNCSSRSVIEEKDRTIAELQQVNALRQASLQETLASLKEFRARLELLSQEKSSLATQLEESTAELAAEKEKVAGAEKARTGVEKKLATAEAALKSVNAELLRVREVASATASELADLRLKSREFKEQSSSLGQNNATLRREATRLNEEMDKLRSELVQARTQLRATSLQSSGNMAAKLAFLEGQVEKLEAANRSLLEERTSLLARLNGPDQEGGVAIVTGQESSNEPAAVLGQVATLAVGRVESMFAGEAAWDAFDIMLVSSAAFVLLGLLWLVLTPRRWRKRRAMKKELALLRKRAETAGKGSGSSRSDGNSRVVRRQRVRSRAGVGRGRRFSPIISGSSVAEETEEVSEEQSTSADAPEEGDAESMEECADDGYVTVHLGTPSRAAATPSLPASPPPRPAPATRSVPEASPEPVANTAPETADLDDDDGLVDDDFGATQLISGLDELDEVAPDPMARTPLAKGKTGAGEKSGAKTDDKDADKELLAELKEMIGQKFDEFLK